MVLHHIASPGRCCWRSTGVGVFIIIYHIAGEWLLMYETRRIREFMPKMRRVRGYGVVLTVISCVELKSDSLFDGIRYFEWPEYLRRVSVNAP